MQFLFYVVVALQIASQVWSTPMEGCSNLPSPSHELSHDAGLVESATPPTPDRLYYPLSTDSPLDYSNFPAFPHDYSSLSTYPPSRHSTRLTYPQAPSTIRSPTRGEFQASSYGTPLYTTSPDLQGSKKYQQQYVSQQNEWAQDFNTNTFNHIARQDDSHHHPSSRQIHQNSQGATSSAQESDAEGEDQHRWERPELELVSRPLQYNEHAWQRKHTEEELDRVYLSIVNKLGPLPRYILQKKIYPRLNERLGNNPSELKAIVDGREEVITRVADDLRTHISPLPSSMEDILTPEAFMKWLKRKLYNRTNVWNRPSWAFPQLTENRSIRFIGRLKARWKMEESVIRALLNYVEPSVLKDFYTRIFLNKDKQDQDFAAKELYNYIMAKRRS